METSVIGPARVAPTLYQDGDELDATTAHSRWSGLYKAGGAAALISVSLIVAAIVAHVVWTPPPWSPSAAVEWFSRFESSWLLGLLGLDLLIVFGLVLSVPVLLALYLALRQSAEGGMILATVLALLGVVLHLSSNTAFEMLSLSQGYAAATTEAQRAMLLAAGEAALAAYYGTAFHVSYVLGYVAKIVIGAVMLRSSTFGRPTAYVGILAGIVGLGNYVPTIGLLLSIVSVVLIAVWNALISWRLFELGRLASGKDGISWRHWA